MSGRFKDTKGRDWAMALTFGAASRIRDATGIPLLKRNDDGEFGWLSLPFDPEKFIDAVWILIGGEADQRGVTRADFEDSFDTETYQAAAAAFYEAVVSFSPAPAVRLKALGTGVEMIRRMTELTITNDGDGNSPAGSESTRAA